MNYKIAICDDENKDIEKLSSHINCYSFDIDTKIEIFPFISGNDLYHSCENGASYDIIFIDIEMPNCNGIEIARKIKVLTTESLIVFVSNYPEYMQESFSAHPYFFLQKPINRSQIFQILDDSIEHMKKNNSHIVIVNNNGINVVVLMQIADAAILFEGDGAGIREDNLHHAVPDGCVRPQHGWNRELFRERRVPLREGEPALRPCAGRCGAART